MKKWSQTARSGGAVLVSLALALSQTASAAASADNPERGRQGEILPDEIGVLLKPYSRGVEVVGHSSVFGRSGNIQLQWADHCAYVASTIPQINFSSRPLDPAKEGVAVVDVRDPAHPRDVGLLRTPGSIRSAETISAVSAPKRQVLVAGSYAGGNSQFGPKDPAALDIYDATDCAHPKLMAQYVWPVNSHSLTLSPDGRYVFGTAQAQFPPFTGRGGLQVLDIKDMAHPKYLGILGITGPQGKSWEFSSHEISFSKDGRRIYAAVTDSTGDDLNPGLRPGFSQERISPDNGGIYVLDNSDLMDGKPDPKLRLIGTVRHGGWHSVVPARIGGVPYLVGGGELSPCPGAVPKLSNMADETHPFLVSEFRLEMNHQENCPPPQVGGLNPFGAPSATLHYNDVDSATDTRLGLFNFTVAGLRIADLRDPKNPVEVAYFRPGDLCTGHVRYEPKHRTIMFTCFESGLWLIKLKPEVRAALGRR